MRIYENIREIGIRQYTRIYEKFVVFRVASFSSGFA